MAGLRIHRITVGLAWRGSEFLVGLYSDFIRRQGARIPRESIRGWFGLDGGRELHRTSIVFPLGPGVRIPRRLQCLSLAGREFFVGLYSGCKIGIHGWGANSSRITVFSLWLGARIPRELQCILRREPKERIPRELQWYPMAGARIPRELQWFRWLRRGSRDLFFPRMVIFRASFLLQFVFRKAHGGANWQPRALTGWFLAKALGREFLENYSGPL